MRNPLGLQAWRFFPLAALFLAVTAASASDEKQPHARLDFILENQVLLGAL